MKKAIFILFISLCSVIRLYAQIPNDDADAREAAIARLQKASPCKVCNDIPAVFMPYGTSCNSREFQAPPILNAPKIQWELNPGWWSIWKPVSIGNFILTGSCNNETNAGLSAIDKKT